MRPSNAPQPHWPFAPKRLDAQFFKHNPQPKPPFEAHFSRQLGSKQEPSSSKGFYGLFEQPLSLTSAKLIL